ncbi:hypothetical protein AB0F96_41040 [Streptomyces sp. NPDC023998]|uniref:hypothetical protein n=1 Tax=Streptomyces sp. NPDC023998 TaxID=3154597 RepID=UPI0033C8DF3C
MISLQIPAANGLIVLLSLLAGFAVYFRRSRDIAAAVAAAVACLLVLGFLFGLGDGTPQPKEHPSAPTAPVRPHTNTP